MKLSLASASSSEGQRTITNPQKRHPLLLTRAPLRSGAVGPLRPCRPHIRPPLLLQRLEQALRRQLSAPAFSEPERSRTVIGRVDSAGRTDTSAATAEKLEQRQCLAAILIVSGVLTRVTIWQHYAAAVR